MSLENPNEKNEVSKEDLYASFETPEIYQSKAKNGGMRRRDRNILITVIACIACVAIGLTLFLTVFRPIPEENNATDLDSILDKSVVLLDKTPTNGQNQTVISSIVCKNTNETVELINKDGVLVIKGYETLDRNTANIKSINDMLTKLVAIEDIGEVENPADYGLDKPQITFTVTYTDGTTTTWEVGDIAPDQSGCYMHKPDDKHVYILDIDQVGILSQTRLDYLSTTIFTQPALKDGADDTAEVVLRSLTYNGTLHGNRTFTVRLVTSGDPDAYIYYNYIITAPYLKGVNPGHDTTLGAFTSLSAAAVECVNPTAAQLKEYGLDNPYSVMKFTLSQRTTKSTESDDDNALTNTSYVDLVEHTLRVSKVSSDYYYVMIDDRPLVYLVASADLALASKRYEDLADTMLFLEDITHMGTFTVNTVDSKTTFNLSHNSSIDDVAKNLVVTAGGKTYDTMDFRYLVNNFMAVDRYGDLTESTAGLPLRLEISFTRIGQTKPTLTAKFYELSSGRYAVEFSHGERYTVKASDVTFVIEQYKNYLAGKTVLRK